MNDDEFESIDDAAAVAALDTIEKERGLSQMLDAQFSQEAKAPRQKRHVVNPYTRHAPERGISQNLGAQFSQEAKAPHQKRRHVVKNPYKRHAPSSEAHHKLSMFHNVNWSAETDTVYLSSTQDKDRSGAMETQSTTKHSQAVSVVTPTTKERTQQKPTAEEDEFGDMDEDLLVAHAEEVERQLAKKHGTGTALVTPTKNQLNEILQQSSSTDEFGNLEEAVLETQSTTKHSQAVSVVTPTIKERTQLKPTTEEDEFGDMDEELLVAHAEEVERRLAKKHGASTALVTPTKNQLNEILQPSSTDEFGNLEEAVLVAQFRKHCRLTYIQVSSNVEEVEQKLAKKPVPPQQHLSTPKNYMVQQYKTPEMPSRKLQLKQVSPKKHGAAGTLIGVTVMKQARARALKDDQKQSVLTVHNFKAPKRPARGKPRSKHDKPQRQYNQQRLSAFTATAPPTQQQLYQRNRQHKSAIKEQQQARRDALPKLQQLKLHFYQDRPTTPPTIHDPPDSSKLRVDPTLPCSATEPI